jgi:hypothetical protein
MRQIITISPKREKYVPVSRTTSPVTHVAELAVKYASRKLVGVPLDDDMGRLRSIPPVSIIKKKLRAIIVLGLIFMAGIILQSSWCVDRIWLHLYFPGADFFIELALFKFVPDYPKGNLI